MFAGFAGFADIDLQAVCASYAGGEFLHTESKDNTFYQLKPHVLNMKHKFPLKWGW